jgi:hypothetical protein
MNEGPECQGQQFRYSTNSSFGSEQVCGKIGIAVEPSDPVNFHFQRVFSCRDIQVWFFTMLSKFRCGRLGVL